MTPLDRSRAMAGLAGSGASTTSAGPGIAADGGSLDRLKRNARDDPRAAVQQAAQQFEALFLQSLLKKMRESMPKSGLMDSQAQQTYTEMLDQQLAVKMAAGGTGLSAVIAKQLMRNLPAAAGGAQDVAAGAAGSAAAGAGGGAGAATTASPAGASHGASRGDRLKALRAAGVNASAATLQSLVEGGAGAGTAGALPTPVTAPTGSTAPARRVQPGAGLDGSTVPVRSGVVGVRHDWRPIPGNLPPSSAPGGVSLQSTVGGLAATVGSVGDAQRGFVAQHAASAAAAERATGVPARFVLGQAALESGWGRFEIKGADGRSSHNLFGIKADPSWKGASVAVTTTEYVDGQPRKQVERFRAYASYEEAFTDWAKLMSDNPRYAQVVRAGQSAEGFAQGLQRAGYATDPAYGRKVLGAIHAADLASGLLRSGAAGTPGAATGRAAPSA